MIPYKVDGNRRVKIRFGDEATLVAGSGGLGYNPEFVNAVYLGWTPETRKLHGCFGGEGHIFAKLDKHDGLSFYLASSLKMGYWSDGDDDPSYAVGIYAWKTDRVVLNQSEREYVFSILDKRRVVSNSNAA